MSTKTQEFNPYSSESTSPVLSVKEGGLTQRMKGMQAALKKVNRIYLGRIVRFVHKMSPSLNPIEIPLRLGNADAIRLSISSGGGIGYAIDVVCGIGEKRPSLNEGNLEILKYEKDILKLGKTVEKMFKFAEYSEDGGSVNDLTAAIAGPPIISNIANGINNIADNICNLTNSASEIIKKIFTGTSTTEKNLENNPYSPHPFIT